MGQITDLQKRVWANKVAKGFDNETVETDLLLTHEELSEVFDAYRKQLNDLDEELADVVIYTLGLAEKLGINLEEALLKKMDINEARTYKKTKEGYFKKEK